MDHKQTESARRRLLRDYENVTKSLHRSQAAAKEIQLENTEDEGDLASISHERDVLYNLHEGGFARAQSIEAALRAVDRGEYGRCVTCGNDINQKRLEAVPWAKMCIRCQEAAEADQTSKSMPPAGTENEDTEL